MIITPSSPLWAGTYFFASGKWARSVRKWVKNGPPSPCWVSRLNFHGLLFCFISPNLLFLGGLARGAAGGLRHKVGEGVSWRSAWCCPAQFFQPLRLSPHRGPSRDGVASIFCCFFLECTLHPASIQTRCMVELNCCPGLKQYA